MYSFKLSSQLIIVGIILIVYIPALFILSNFYKHKAEPFPVVGGEYVQLAENLIKYKAFSLDTSPPHSPETFRTPGYPLFLAFFKLIFNNYLIVSFIQIILVAITGLLVFEIGEKLFSKTVSLIAVLFFLLDPITIFQTLVTSTDLLFTFLVILSVYLLFFMETKKEYQTSFFGGLLTGYLVLVRPAGILLPLLFGLFYFFSKQKTRTLPDIRRAALLTSVFFLACSLVLAPWIIRNKIVSDSWNISSIGAFNLFSYNVPMFLASKYGGNLETIRNDLNKEIGNLSIQELISLKNSKLLITVSLKYISQDPLGYMKFHLMKTSHFFLGSGLKNLAGALAPERLNDILEGDKNKNLTDLIIQGKFKVFFKELKSQFIFTMESVFWLIITIFSFVSLIFSIFLKRQRFYAILFLGLILYSAIVPSPAYNARYKLPVEPFIFLFALAGFSLFLNGIKNLKERIQKSAVIK